MVILVFILTLITFASSCSGALNAAPQDSAPSNIKDVFVENSDNIVEKGEWGGEDIRMLVEETGAAIQFACADARIDDVLKTDPKGAFSVSGVYIAQSPGPQRIDNPPLEKKARFSGVVDGKNMTLTITLIDADNEIGTFNLRHGQTVRVRRCY